VKNYQYNLSPKEGMFMGNVDRMKNAAKGATVAVGLAVALPVFGPVGSLTAAGAAVASVVGGIAGLLDD